MDTITYVVSIEPGRRPSFYRLDEHGAPTPVPVASLPARLKRCGQSLYAWASGLPNPPGGLAGDLLNELPRAFPMSVAVLVNRIGPYNLQ
jgi:hypothetical protein